MSDNLAEFEFPDSDDEALAVINLSACDENIPPLLNFRNGHVYVSDLSSQMYCEKKLLYSFLQPPEVEVVQPPEVMAGSNIHLARELEVHDLVSVRTNTREDRYAVTYLNLLSSVRNILNGATICREVPVFGIPFDSGVFVTGIIDEMRCSPETFDIDLVELKTRSGTTLPGAGVQKSYELQVMLYKHLMDRLITGKLKSSDIAEHLKLNLEQVLSEDVLRQLSRRDSHLNSLGKLLDEVLSSIQALPLPGNLFIEYYSQKDACTFKLKEIQYDVDWLQEKYMHLIQFWQGSRKATGIEVEEAWKCRTCPYAAICDWRQTKDLECRRKNVFNDF